MTATHTTTFMLVAVAALVASVVCLAGWFRSEPPLERFDCTPEEALALSSLADRIRGTVVYQRYDPDNRKTTAIFSTRIGERTSRLLAHNASFPRWAPDGRTIAYLSGNRLMIMASDGQQKRCLGKIEKPRALNFHPNGKDILFTDSGTISLLSIADGSIRELVVSALPFTAADISSDSRYLITAARGHRVRMYDLQKDKRWTVAQGCSACFSPDDRFIIHLRGTHRNIDIVEWSSEALHARLPSPAGRTTDNESWSNRRNWLVTRTEHTPFADLYVYDIGATNHTRVTFLGDCNRPDLFIAWERPDPLP